MSRATKATRSSIPAIPGRDGSAPSPGHEKNTPSNRALSATGFQKDACPEASEEPERVRSRRREVPLAAVSGPYGTTWVETEAPVRIAVIELGACTEPTTMVSRLSRARAKAAVSITLRSRAMASSWVMRS